MAEMKYNENGWFTACSSSPCKYPATCQDGATTDEYTCTCTTGYSGENCDVVAGTQNGNHTHSWVSEHAV